MNAPATIFEDGLSQFVAVSGRPRLVILGSVALDAKHEALGLVRVANSDVDEEPRASDLGLDFVSLAPELRDHLLFERRHRFQPRLPRNVHPAGWDGAWTKRNTDGYGIDRTDNVVVFHRWGEDSTGGLEHFRVGVGAARKGWLTKAQVVNCLSRRDIGQLFSA